MAVSGKPLVVERVADGGHAAVHHVAGGDEVGAALGVRHGHLGEQLEGDVVDDLAVLHHAAVAVVHVLAEADVGDDHEVGELVLDGAHGHLHDALGVVGAGRRRVLVRGDAEQQDRRDAELDDLAHLAEQVADGELEAPGHRGDGVLDVLAGDHEERVDEIVDRERGLAEHVADGRRATQAPHAVAGVVHGVVSFRTGAAASPCVPAIFPRRESVDKRAAPLRRRLSARRAPAPP